MLWHLRTMLTFGMLHWQEWVFVAVICSLLRGPEPTWQTYGLAYALTYVTGLGAFGNIRTLGRVLPHPTLPMTLRTRALTETLEFLLRLSVPFVVWTLAGFFETARALTTLASIAPVLWFARVQVNAVRDLTSWSLPFLMISEPAGWFGLHRGLSALMGGGPLASVTVSTLGFVLLVAWGRPVLPWSLLFRFGRRQRRESSARAEPRRRPGHAGAQALRMDLWRSLRLGLPHAAGVMAVTLSLCWLASSMDPTGSGDTYSTLIASAGIVGACVWFMWFVAGRPLGLSLGTYKSRSRTGSPFTVLPLTKGQLTAALGLHALGALVLGLSIPAGVALGGWWLARPSWSTIATLVAVIGVCFTPVLWGGLVAASLGGARTVSPIVGAHCLAAAFVLDHQAGEPFEALRPLDALAEYATPLAILACVNLALGLWLALRGPRPHAPGEGCTWLAPTIDLLRKNLR